MNYHCPIKPNQQRNDRSTRSARAKSLDLSHVTEVKSKKKKTNRTSFTNLASASPKRSISVCKSQAETSHSASIHSFEEVLYDQLVALMVLVLKSNSSRTFHDYSMLQDHIQTRAVAAVEEELQAISSKLLLLQGPNPNHRVSAYAQLLSSLTHTVENAVFNIDRRAVTNMKNDNLAVRIEQEQRFSALNEKLARKDQTILAMQAEQSSMEFKNKSLIRTVELLSKELEKCNSNLTAAHQRSVEVRMQAIDFKAEIDKRAQRVRRSVHSRVGFIPESIQKQLGLLTSLVAPGDANYDKVRMEMYKKASSMPGGTVSASCSPMSASRKGAMLSGGISSLPSSPRSSFASRRSSTSSRSTDRSSILVVTEPDPVSVETAAEDAPGLTHSFSPNFEKAKFLSTDTLSTSASVSRNSPIGCCTGGSRLSPSRRDAQRRQVLITSLFPRASFNLQESTGIADLSFPNNQYDAEDQEPVEDAPHSKGKGVSGPVAAQVAAQVSAAVQQAARTALGPTSEQKAVGKEHLQSRRYAMPAVPMDDSIDDSDSESVQDSLGVAHYQKEEDMEVEVVDSGSEGDVEQINVEENGAEESEDDDDIDMGETRTNPSASQVSFSSSDSDTEGEGSFISNTSPGADDELPTSGNTSQSATHSASYGIAMAAHPPGTTLHYLPKVAAVPPGIATTSVAASQAYSESDEGGDFYGNMQRFLRTFEETHIVDVSDSSEADGESKGRSHSDLVPHPTAAATTTSSRHSDSSTTATSKRLVGSTKIGRNNKDTGAGVPKKPTKHAVIT